MTTTEFCYWLQGYFEISSTVAHPLTEEQVKIIQNHLAMVFKHDIDPKAGPESHQQELQLLHDGGKPPHNWPTHETHGPAFRC